MRKILYPKTYVPSVVDIQVDWLREKGIKGVLFDLDNTIIRRDSEQFPQEVVQYIYDLRSQGFAVGIVSNGRSRRVKRIAKQLGVPAIYRAAKPLSRPFRRALKMLGTTAEETVLIGDQIFTDVLGGNLAGLHTILVIPMAGKDFWGSRLISRPLEKLVLARLRKRTGLAYDKPN